MYRYLHLVLECEGKWAVLACTIPFHSFINNQGVSQSFNNIMEIQVDMQRNYYLIIIIRYFIEK